MRFLEYGRAFQLEKQLIEPAKLLHDMEQGLTDQAHSQRVLIEREIQPCGKLEADPTLLATALYNIGLNALQAMAQGGTMILRLKNEGVFTLFEVEDTGTGIPEGLKANLFKPFFSNRDGGTGLGLAFAKKVVESHGGRIEAFNRQNQTPGQPGGALLRIYLPLEEGF
jgi:two-component system sensor histidine kinase FlrB